MLLITNDLSTIKKVPLCYSSLPVLSVFYAQSPNPLHLPCDQLPLCYICNPPLPECWPASTHSMSVKSSLFFSLLLLLSFLLSVLSIHRSNRQQRQRPGALHGAAPARGPGPTAGSDQVHQEGASVSLQRLQERMSVCSASHRPSFSMQEKTYYPTFPSCLEQECPSGMVDEETFKTIYSQFFPQGGQRFSQVWKFLKVSLRSNFNKKQYKTSAFPLDHRKYIIICEVLDSDRRACFWLSMSFCPQMQQRMLTSCSTRLI